MFNTLYVQRTNIYHMRNFFFFLWGLPKGLPICRSEYHRILPVPLGAILYPEE